MDGSFAPDLQDGAGEQRIDFGDGTARLSLLVPSFFDRPARMIEALSAGRGAEQTHLILFDDGSRRDLSAETQALKAWPGPASLVVSSTNLGRAQARNRLLAHAGTDWLLLLDADMLPDCGDFLQRYLTAIESADKPILVAGGFSLDPVEVQAETRLHAAQSLRSECLGAAERARQPGRYVFTSNILVHREILETVAFDEGYQGWGWEDVDWGLRVASRFPVLHIDNTATHPGLDTDAALMRKYAGSGANFARLAARHSEAITAMALWRATCLMRRLGPFGQLGGALAGAFARNRALPMRLRLLGLKAWRAAIYARHLK